MDQILKFPDPLEEARLRAEEFQRLSPDERWQIMASMMATGWQLVHISPNRNFAEGSMNKQEAQWQILQKTLINRHG